MTSGSRESRSARASEPSDAPASLLPRRYEQARQRARALPVTSYWVPFQTQAFCSMIVTLQRPSRLQASSASSSQSAKKLLVAAEQVEPVPEQLTAPPGTQTQAAKIGSGTNPRAGDAQDP